MLLSPLKVVISLFFSLPLNLITCSNSPTYQKRAKNSRMVDRMPSICQKYLSDPGPEWADHRPSPQTHTDGSGVDNCPAWPPRKPTKMHNPLPRPTFQTAIKFYVHRKRQLSAKFFQQDLRTELHLLPTQGYPSHHLGLTRISLLFLP